MHRRKRASERERDKERLARLVSALCMSGKCAVSEVPGAANNSLRKSAKGDSPNHASHIVCTLRINDNNNSVEHDGVGSGAPMPSEICDDREGMTPMLPNSHAAPPMPLWTRAARLQSLACEIPCSMAGALQRKMRSPPCGPMRTRSTDWCGDVAPAETGGRAPWQWRAPTEPWRRGGQRGRTDVGFPMNPPQCRAPVRRKLGNAAQRRARRIRT